MTSGWSSRCIPTPVCARWPAPCWRTLPRVHLIDPLPYEDFALLLSRAWLLVSDSGGIQEEAPTLRKPVLVIRENTERQEAVEAGTSKLVGGDPLLLRAHLEEIHGGCDWAEKVRRGETPNPYGDGEAGRRIAEAIASRIPAGARVHAQ